MFLPETWKSLYDVILWRGGMIAGPDGLVVGVVLALCDVGEHRYLNVPVQRNHRELLWKQERDRNSQFYNLLKFNTLYGTTPINITNGFILKLQYTWLSLVLKLPLTTHMNAVSPCLVHLKPLFTNLLQNER